MTVRRRIVIGVVVLFSVVLAIAGSLSVQALQDRLVADVDQVLLERSGFIERVASRQFTFPRGDRVQDDVFPSAQDMAVVVVGADGEEVLSVPSGRSDQPDPLPDVGALDLAALAASGDVVQVEVDGGDVAYRVAVSPIGDGVGFAVLAIPLDSVHSAVGATSAILLIAGLVAVAAAGLLAWWVVRAAMRPVDDMIATAGQVAGGDLSPRIEATDDGTEMGQLAGALNTMLGRIEEAVDAKSESEARMRRFLSDASHELRTPLTSIRGYAELYRRGATSPEDVERSFDRIEREATRMSTLVEDLLLLARLDQQRPLESAPVDIAALVTEAVEAARIVDDERSISIEVPPTPLIVPGDATRLRQVLDNLLVNVRHHTPPGTAVTVSVDAGGDAAIVTVVDDGPGMTAVQVDHAFERFYQAEPAGGRSGAGLGLAIVKAVAEAHGGAIRLESAPEDGTRVTLRLPVAAAAAG